MLRDNPSKQQMQVAVRIRPLSQKQQKKDSRMCILMQQANSLQITVGDNTRQFIFDNVLNNNSQEDMFEKVGKQCILDCIEGYNVTVFAYGQTGAGKTYTMAGYNYSHPEYYLHRGLIPRSVQYLYECIKRQQANGSKYEISCSFLQIFNEQITDLLNKSNNVLQLRESIKKGVYASGLKELVVQQVCSAIHLFNQGFKYRKIGSNQQNYASSISHCIFIIYIQSIKQENGISYKQKRQINFIDLAGLQRIKEMKGQKLKQACNINKSLMNLSSVIKALAQKNEPSKHITYRNSKLAFLLKGCFQGKSKTTLIANINPKVASFRQTLSTLRFANHLKLIKRQNASTISFDSSIILQPMKAEIQEEAIFDFPLTVDEQQKKNNIMIEAFNGCLKAQIQKQKYFEEEIIKLNRKIEWFKRGMQKFNINQIHLRLIINIFQDKINRLKQVENQIENSLIKGKISDETIINYLQKQRDSFINRCNNLIEQSKKDDFSYQALKLTCFNETNKRIQSFLTKNSEYLAIIQKLFDQIVSNRAQDQSLTKRNIEVQYKEKVKSLRLQLQLFRSKNQQCQILVQQANNSKNIAIEKYGQQENKLQQTICKLKQDNFELNQSLRILSQNKDQQFSIVCQQIASHKQKQQTLSKEIQFQLYKIEKIQLQNHYLNRHNQQNNAQIANMKDEIKQLYAENQQLNKRLNNNQNQYKLLNKHMQEEVICKKIKMNQQDELILKMKKQVQDCQKQLSNILESLQKEKILNEDLQGKINSYQEIKAQLLLQQQKNQNSYKQVKDVNEIDPFKLLEQSKAEQLNLSKQNKQLCKIITSLKESLQQKQDQIQINEQNYQKHCGSLLRYIDEVQKQYYQLASDHKALIRQGNTQLSQEKQLVLKDQIRTLKINSAKITKKNQGIQVKITKGNFSSIKLQKDYKQIKKGDTLQTKDHQKTQYINRLKAEIALLKTQRVLLTDSLSKQREQRAKLQKKDRKREKIQNQLKQQLQTKLNQIKLKNESFYQIANKLNLSVSLTFTLPQQIRQLILAKLAQKDSELFHLKQRLKKQQLQELSSSKLNYAQDRQKIQNKHQFLMNKRPTLNETANRRHQTEIGPKCVYIKTNTYSKFSQMYKAKRNLYI